ncbi:MAG: VWA domain-containing protein [Xanthobacteraceae bacterium]|nr:VWA domain-containing protein [Xanthobacteraceae bacterium]
MQLAQFLRNQKGGVAPLLGLAIVPMIGIVGAAVDYSRANSTRTAMQAALDSAALMMSKDAQTLTPAQLDAKATTYFNALFHRPEASNVQVTQQFGSPAAGNFAIKLTGTATMSTVVWRVVGQQQMTITATGEVVWGIKKLNLALALDNTGSMASSDKMTELKKAAHNLLDTLKKAEKTPGDIKISIVPFAVDVNVGTNNVNQPWIDWADWDDRNGTCSVSISNPKTKSKCQSNNGTWTPAAHSTWNGCVMDRDQNNDVNAIATGDGAATKYRAHQATNCPTAMMPLSTDWTALKGKIDAMTPAGNTNVTIGMQMAWQTLTPAAPFNAPAVAPDLDKVIILLTDGQNTQNRWSSSTTSIDSRTQKVCDNARAANIKVYTVRVIDGNATLLQSCATKPDMYFNVQQASQLNSVFSSIAQNLANLRIAK